MATSIYLAPFSRIHALYTHRIPDNKDTDTVIMNKSTLCAYIMIYIIILPSFLSTNGIGTNAPRDGLSEPLQSINVNNTCIYIKKCDKTDHSFSVTLLDYTY